MHTEHSAVWNAAVDCAEAEIALAAAARFIQRANAAREHLFEALHPSLPAPVETPPVALSEAPTGYQNGHYWDDPLGEGDLEMPRYMRGSA